ncbi:hypothetical protein BH10PLA1_BH10PLA1_03780 [soil metagenome]
MKRRAFTIVELLVVLAIVAVLVALLMPAVNRIRQAAQSTVCQSNSYFYDQLGRFYTLP